MKQLRIIALLALIAPSITFAKPPSLRNPHNFCYLNAALQALNSLTFFTEAIEASHAGIFYAENTLPSAFCNFIAAAKTGNYENELNELQDIAAPVMLALAGGAEACGQQDASEFTRKLLTDFLYETEVGDFAAVITKLFYSENKPYVTCPNPAASKPVKYDLATESLNALDLPMLNKLTITLEDLLNNYKTDKNYPYRGRTDCTKINDLTYAPIVIINLQRFKVIPGQAIVKFDKPVQVPLKTKFNGMDYELKSVIVQSGGIAGGHYIAYVKEGNTWWKCDDTRITEVDSIPELTKAIKDGYNFFYQSITKPVVEPVQPPSEGPAHGPAKEPVTEPTKEPEKGPDQEPIINPLQKTLSAFDDALKNLATAFGA